MQCCKWRLETWCMRPAFALGASTQCRLWLLFSGIEATDHWARQLCGLLKGLAVIKEGPGDMLNVRTHESCDSENRAVKPCFESLEEHQSYPGRISVPTYKSPSLLSDAPPSATTQRTGDSIGAVRAPASHAGQRHHPHARSCDWHQVLQGNRRHARVFCAALDGKFLYTLPADPCAGL